MVISQITIAYSQNDATYPRGHASQKITFAFEMRTSNYDNLQACWTTQPRRAYPVANKVAINLAEVILK